MGKTRAKGGLIIDDLQVGDIIYERAWGQHIRSKVIEKPKKTKHGAWEWKTRTGTGEEIEYLITPGLTHYGPELISENDWKKSHPSL